MNLFYIFSMFLEFWHGVAYLFMESKCAWELSALLLFNAMD